MSSKSHADLSTLVRDMSSNELPSGSVCLSNRERLLLRKQALTMKKRSVLSVGIVFGFIFLLPMFVCSRLPPHFPSLSKFMLCSLTKICLFCSSILCGLPLSLFFFFPGGLLITETIVCFSKDSC